ncbi:MAG: hypothetical protein U5K71_15315 [Gracilimonas sp.]|nr:hypothetical protein [Gracilimonas sp.]
MHLILRENEARFYVINLNGDISAVEKNWSGNGHGASVIYGLDDTQNYLYYTDNYIYSPEEIIRLNYETGNESAIILDEKGERFSLISGWQSHLPYEKIQPDGDADVSIISIFDTTSILAPRDSTIKSNRSPKWISDNEITFNAFGESDGLGVFKANIVDSTIEQLTKLNGRWGYDVSKDGEIVVLSAEIEGDDGLSESSIFLKNTHENDPIYIGPGTYPHFSSNQREIYL